MVPIYPGPGKTEEATEQGQAGPGGKTEDPAGQDEQDSVLYQIVTDNLRSIVRTLTPLPNGAAISTKELNLKRTYGLREGCDFLAGRLDFTIAGNGGPRRLKFYMKRYPDKGRPDYIPSMSLEQQIYDLMAGSGVVPRAYLLEGVDNLLLLESAGDRTLDERLFRNHLSPKEKDELVKHAIDALATFTTYAGRTASEILRGGDRHLELRQWLTSVGAKDMEASARRYFKVVKPDEAGSDDGQEKEATGSVIHNYAPIIRVYSGDGQQIIHGDGGAQNFLGPLRAEWTDNINLVDLASLRFGFPVFDLAQLLTSPGMHYKPENWDEFLDYFMGRSVPACARSNESDRRAATQFYSAAIHEPCKRVIRKRDFAVSNPRQYEQWMESRPSLDGSDEEMSVYVGDALHHILSKPGKFQFNGEDLRRLGAFQKYLKAEGVLS